MDRYLSRELDHCFALHQPAEKLQDSSSGRKKSTIVSLALEKYVQKSAWSETPDRLSAGFKKFVICHLKGIILAGHGTTANTLYSIYHLLSSNPTTLQRIREEHDTVFGVDLEQSASRMIEEPHLLNRLSYTLAVIKEALRLYPADSSSRREEPGLSLSQDGQQYPTEGCDVWTLIQAIHRDPSRSAILAARGHVHSGTLAVFQRRSLVSDQRRMATLWIRTPQLHRAGAVLVGDETRTHHDHPAVQLQRAVRQVGSEARKTGSEKGQRGGGVLDSVRNESASGWVSVSSWCSETLTGFDLSTTILRLSREISKSLSLGLWKDFYFYFGHWSGAILPALLKSKASILLCMCMVEEAVRLGIASNRYRLPRRTKRSNVADRERTAYSIPMNDEPEPTASRLFITYVLWSITHFVIATAAILAF